MTKDKMMEKWRSEYEEGYYKCVFTPVVQEYLEGKTDVLEGTLIQSAPPYADYDSWLVNELDGENADLARRMLFVLSKVRRRGIIQAEYYGAEKEMAVCFRIGYSFDDILKAIFRGNKKIGTKSLYELAEVAVRYNPVASATQADFQLKFAEIPKQRPEGYYFALFLALHLIKEKGEDYAGRYLPTFIALAGEYRNEAVLTLLYHAYDLAPELKEKLLEGIRESSYVALYLKYLTGNAKGMLDFLEKVGGARWGYYYLIADNMFYDKDVSEEMTKLYREDEALFMETYGHLKRDKRLVCTLMLSLLFRDGKAAEADCKDLGLKIWKWGAEYLCHLINRNGKGADPVTSLQLANPATTDDDWRKWLDMMMLNYYYYYRSDNRMDVFSALYDYVPEAKKMVDHLLLKPNKGYNMASYNFVMQFLEARKDWLGFSPRESLQLLLDAPNEFDLPTAFQACAHCLLRFREADGRMFMEADVRAHEGEALEVLTKGKLEVSSLLDWLNYLFGEYGCRDYAFLVGLLGHKSKQIRKAAENYLEAGEKECRSLLEQKLEKMKGDALAAAKRLLKKWDNERKYGKDFRFTNETVVSFCEDNYDKDNQKHIAWIPEEMLQDVRLADLSAKVPVVVMKYILSEYMSLEEPYKIAVCDKLIAMLHPQDVQNTLENIYLLWKDNGAEAKKKMFMIPYCLYASDSQILRLKTQLKDWAEASRGAIAAFVVNAIAMNGGNVALMMVDGISVKFPNNQVKKAAKESFTFAAKALGVAEDVLSDKIVPTLGFSEEGEKVLDYGPRTFTVTLMPDFSLTIFDNAKQKQIKSMPSPAAADDAVKAAAAKKEFSELKKQIKATIQTQTARLEKVLLNGRTWNVDAWTELFVKNPIMHRFATSLIWGVYRDGILEDTFRYMEDGTFNTVDEEEYTLPEKAEISLVHPCELAEDVRAQWKEQLDDYEVIQPLAQMTAPVVLLGEKEVSNKRITRYKGMVTLAGKLSALAKKHNMLRGEVLDAGSYTCFHWVDKYLGVAAQINFEYMYMGEEFNEDVPLEDVLFYRIGENGATDDEPKDNQLVAPSELPERFVCSVIGALDILKTEG